MKKILCLFLSLMMLLSAVVSQADNSMITKVTVYVTLPKAGTTAATPAEISIPLKDDYRVISKIWCRDDNKNALPYDTVFENGKKYKICLVIAPDYGYSFYKYCGIDVIDQNTCEYLPIEINRIDSDTIILFAGFTLPPAVSEPDPKPDPKPDPVPEGPTEKVTLSKLKSVRLTAVSAKKLKVSWKKLSSKDRKKIKKIEIQFSTDKKFRKNVKSKFVSSGKTSYTISGLKKNTKYYVRVRAYTKSGKVINLSKWVTKNQKTRKK